MDESEFYKKRYELARSENEILQRQCSVMRQELETLKPFLIQKAEDKKSNGGKLEEEKEKDRTIRYQEERIKELERRLAPQLAGPLKTSEREDYEKKITELKEKILTITKTFNSEIKELNGKLKQTENEKTLRMSTSSASNGFNARTLETSSASLKPHKPPMQKKQSTKKNPVLNPIARSVNLNQSKPETDVSLFTYSTKRLSKSKIS